MFLSGSMMQEQSWKIIQFFTDTFVVYHKDELSEKWSEKIMNLQACLYFFFLLDPSDLTLFLHITSEF